MEFTWSEKEKEISRQAFELAYERKCQQIIEVIKNYELTKSDDIWKLGNFIDEQEKKVDQLFEYTYSKLILAFALFIQEGLIKSEDLAGLSEDKIENINQIAIL